MRKSVILSLCVVLAVAAGAQAATMFGTGDIANGDFTYTRTSVVLPLEGPMTGNSVTLDRIDISYASAPTGAPGATLAEINGTWETDTNFEMNLASPYMWPAADWRTYIGNVNSATNILHGVSYVNFDEVPSAGYNGMAGNSYTWMESYEGPKGTEWNSKALYFGTLTGDWLTNVSGNELEAGSDLLARFWVKPGGQLSFTGTWDFGGTTLTGGVSTVPEPTTLALIGMGLFGLLCYAWRKRG